MQIQRIIVGPLQTNCYVVSDQNGNAAVIDPGFQEWKIEEKIAGLTVKYIILTHGHYDHFAAAKGIKEKTGAKIAIYKDDGAYLEDINLNLLCWNPSLYSKQISADILLTEADTLTAGELVFSFLHTPGHTIGSMCVFCGDALFTGDTLFQGDVGRTDLPGGDEQALIRSIKTKLKPLTKNYAIYPGHLDFSTLDDEKKYNLYLK